MYFAKVMCLTYLGYVHLTLQSIWLVSVVMIPPNKYVLSVALGNIVAVNLEQCKLRKQRGRNCGRVLRNKSNVAGTVRGHLGRIIWP